MVKQIIVSVGFATVGILFYLATYDIALGIRLKRHLAYARAMTRIGSAVMIALITEAVFHTPPETLTWTWRIILYIIAGFVLFIGALWVAWELRRSGTNPPGDGEVA